MDYIKKICPSCGREFVVLKTIERKATYCTLKCLSKAQIKEKLKGKQTPLAQV